jgi:hypothetical protein
MDVTTDGFWIADRIYWTLWYSAWLHCYTHTSVHSHVFTCFCSVATSNGGRSPSFRFPDHPRPQLPASHSNSSRLNFSSSLTHSLSPLTSRHGPHRKHRSIIVVQLLPWKPLLSNDYCTAASFAVVA